MLRQCSCLAGPEEGPRGLPGGPACSGPRGACQVAPSYCGCSETLLWKCTSGTGASLQIRHKTWGTHLLCCRKVSAFSHNNSSLNRSAISERVSLLRTGEACLLGEVQPVGVPKLRSAGAE